MLVGFDLETAMQSNVSVNRTHPKSATFNFSVGDLVNSKFCGFKSKWLTLWERMYFSAEANWLMKNLHVPSGNVLCFLMYVDKLPALQSSITM